MRIAVLCNDRLGIPAFQQLAQHRLAVAAGVADRSPEMIAFMQSAGQQSGIPIQVFSRKNFESQLHAWLELHKPDVVLVKTFPFRIPSSALNIPAHGFINFHYAPLPQFRGPNPLFWMIRNQVPMAGITVHRMDENFDTGPILLKNEFPLHPELSFGMLTAQLAIFGANLTAQLIQGIGTGTLKPLPQDEKASHWCARPKMEDLFIKWKTMSSPEVIALIKACNPWNKGAAVRFKGWTFAITDASPGTATVPDGTAPGTLLQSNGKAGVSIACIDGKSICAEVLYTEEGFFAGERISNFGLKPGDTLD